MVLLGGEMEGPPEDSNGMPGMSNPGFQKLLKMKTENLIKYKGALRAISTEAMNYNNR